MKESFNKFSPEVIYELSRVFPFHATTLSARPIDAFISEKPSMFDFRITPHWHQLILFNGEKNSREFKIELSGNTAFGALGLDAADNYYLYDFWNDRYIGKFDGDTPEKQSLLSGEARMISVHAVQSYPQ